jgi:hypothetical protein
MPEAYLDFGERPDSSQCRDLREVLINMSERRFDTVLMFDLSEECFE